MNEVVSCYMEGTNDVVRMDGDGLIRSAAGMIWMDVKLGERFVTPREGKAVEINALWYNALRFMEECAERVGRRFEHGGLAAEVKKNFVRKYWNREGGYLYDVVGDGSRDASLRPNQLFAVFLPFQLIEGEKAEKMLSVAMRELLTPFGIRTLAMGDPRYRGVYRGGIWERDAAYHQGTAWVWLLGPFFTALRKVGWFPKSREWAGVFLKNLLSNYPQDAGVGAISEIFDGDEPHKPRGCISQAWQRF